MDKIFFLIDTNIFIQLEDDQIINTAFSKFHSLCNENPPVICIHPLSRQEIEKDKNQNRKGSVLSKIDKYKILEQPPQSNKQQLENLFGDIKNSNDEKDCQLLYVLYKNSVAFLVTEDRGIHKRSKKQNLKNKVLSIHQSNNLIERLFPKNIEFSLPEIKNPYLYNILDNDEIFDSLKNEYPGFEDWFQNCSKEEIKAWTVSSSENSLESICIYKEAKIEDYTKYSLPEKSLKLATFKVSKSHRGKKLGELMLKQAFLYATKNRFKSCWMTVFPKHQMLIDFITDFGFYKIGTTDLKDTVTNEEEMVFQKVFTKPKNNSLKGLDFHIKYFPLFDDGNDVRKCIIPIKKTFYDILFPEYETLFEQKYQQLSFSELSSTGIPGNTIKKVYLCHAPMSQLKRGDLLFFYVSAPIQSIRSIGVVESTFRSNNLSAVISCIGKRSVYNFHQIEDMTKKNVLVIEFRFIKHLDQEVTFEQLKQKNIVQGPPQSIQKLQNYTQFKSLFL